MPKSTDEIKELQRSLNRLERAGGTVLHVGGRPYLVAFEAVVDPEPLLDLLARETVPEAEAIAGLARGCRLREPARLIDGRFLGMLQRDLKVLEKHPDLAALTREAPRLFRGRTIDRSWLSERGAQLARLQQACARGDATPRGLSRWEAAVALVRSCHGDAAAEALLRVRERSTQVSAERRREAQRRIDGLVRRLDGQTPPQEAPALAEFLTEAARQARQAERLPGRARRKRLRQIVAAVLAWPGKPTSPPVDEPESDPAAALSQQVRSFAAQQIALQRSTRSPEFQERLALCLSRYGLLFPPGPDAPVFDEELVRQALHLWRPVREQLGGLPLRLEQALGLLTAPHADPDGDWSAQHLGKVGLWVAQGLDLAQLRELAHLDFLSTLLRMKWDVETVRSYCAWVARLAPLYRQQGLRLALSPPAYMRLRAAKREELAVLGHCLLEHPRPAAGTATGRQIALLDSTLGLFQQLPQKARACLDGLQDAPAGLGERLCPDFAAWLGHDPRLDRYLHLCGLLGLPQTPSKNLLRDFAGAARRHAERAHLEALPDPDEAQQLRILQLSNGAPPPGPGWTLRRLAERCDALAAQLLERRVDQALAEVLRHAFGLALPRITPAWRDVFRFYLSTERNRELLGVLLRNATAQPGRYFPPVLPNNRRWLERAAERMNVASWLRPRRRPIEVDGQRYTLEVEEDPVEVLRMGIPFKTCLSLEDGCNAAATVLNALDVNKRVLYVKDTAGTLVARQLIAVSKDFALLRYHLYSALSPDHEEVLAAELRALCEEIARETGLPLGNEGEPEDLHAGFWYDDGIEPFGEEKVHRNVEACCRSFGLPPPPVVPDSLLTEAERWDAARARDVARFARHVEPWRESLAQAAQGEHLIAALGLDELIRCFREGAPNLLSPLLRHHAAQGVESLLRASRRLMPGSRDEETLIGFVRSFPLPPAAMIEVAAQAGRLNAPASPFAGDFALSTLSELRPQAGAATLAQHFDLCDRLEPAWDRIAEREPYWEGACRDNAHRLISEVESIFLRDPDGRAAVNCLRSRRRSALAQRAALRVLALFPFPRQSGQSLAPSALTVLERAPSDAPWARKALQDLAVRRPEIGRSPEMLAALLRQGASIDLATWPLPEESPFRELRDLVLHVPALATHLGPPPTESLWWTPLVRQALRVLQMERGALATADKTSHRELARALEALTAAGLPDDWWVSWLGELFAGTGGAPLGGPLLVQAVERWLAGRTVHLLPLLPPKLLLWLWEVPPLQAPLLAVLLHVAEPPSILRLYRALRDAAQERPIDLQDLLERWILALLDKGCSFALAHTGDRDFLLLLVRTVLERADPKHRLSLYHELSDPLVAALFLRELARRPQAEIQQLRDLVRPADDDWKERRAYRFWLESYLRKRLMSGKSRSTYFV